MDGKDLEDLAAFKIGSALFSISLFICILYRILMKRLNLSYSSKMVHVSKYGTCSKW